MANTDQNITDLPIKVASEVVDGDYLMGIDLVEGYQVSAKDFADYALNSASVSINGTTQTAANAINGKVSKETGKGLSTNDFTTALKNKLDGIAANAEVNVNADWTAASGDAQILNKPTLGTASARDVPSSGNASAAQVVLGNDTRLSDSRPASDVSSWAKASSKPTYTKSEVGLGNVGNFKAVSTEASQGLTSTEKANAQANLGLGTAAVKNVASSIADGNTDLVTSDQIYNALADVADGGTEHTVTAANPITFTTDSAQMAKNTKVTFEPIQDLHGYDHPWPAGGGKNLLPKGGNRTHNGITFTVQDDGTILITNTASGNAFWGLSFTLPAGSYAINGCPSGGGLDTYRIDIRDSLGGSLIDSGYTDSGSGFTMTLSESLTAYLCIRVANGYACPSGGILLKPMIRLASESDSTFAPYSNICPISGLDQVEVESSKEYFKFTIAQLKAANPSYPWSGNSYTRGGLTFNFDTDDDGYVTKYTVNGTATARVYMNFWIDSNPLSNTPLKVGDNLHLSGSYKDGSYHLYMRAGRSSGNYLYFYDYGNGVDGIVPDNCTTFSLYDSYENGFVANNITIRPHLYKTEETDTAEVPLPTTIYSGELDLESGVLVATHKRVIMDGTTTGLKFTQKGSGDNNNFYDYLTDADISFASSTGWLTESQIDEHQILNSHFAFTDSGLGFRVYINLGAGNMQPRAQFGANSDITTVALANTWLANQYSAGTPFAFTYPLATPIIYQLTPQQLALFKGTNVVSTNASKVRVTYRDGQLALMGDTPQQLQIEEAKTNAKLKQVLGNFAEIEGDTVSKNYAVGSYLVHNGLLRKVTSAIASGESVTNLNSTVTTIADELTLLWTAVNA